MLGGHCVRMQSRPLFFESAGADTSRATARPVVHVIDSEHETRSRLQELFVVQRMEVLTYEDAETFLAIGRYPVPACLVAAVELPGMSGLELLERLYRDGIQLPVILTATHSTVPAAVRAMRGGAVDFLEKPFVDRVLIQRVRAALAV